MNSDLDCIICYENKPTDIYKKTSCQHTFHLNCLNIWLSTKSTCPVCRTVLIIDIDTGEIPVRIREEIVPYPVIINSQRRNNYNIFRSFVIINMFVGIVISFIILVNYYNYTYNTLVILTIIAITSLGISLISMIGSYLYINLCKN